MFLVIQLTCAEKLPYISTHFTENCVIFIVFMFIKSKILIIISLR